MTEKEQFDLSKEIMDLINSKGASGEQIVEVLASSTLMTLMDNLLCPGCYVHTLIATAAAVKEEFQLDFEEFVHFDADEGIEIIREGDHKPLTH